MNAGFVSLTHDTGTPEDPIILFVKEVIGEHGRLGVSKPEAILLPPREGATPFKEEFRTHVLKLSANIAKPFVIHKCITGYTPKMALSHPNNPLIHRISL